MTQTLRHKILVEIVGFFFFCVELDYENLPDFYTKCKVIDHFLEICKKVNIEEENLQEKEHVDRRRKGTEPMKAVVQTKDGRLERSGRVTSCF